MTGTADLERNYRQWLRWYPKSFRREHKKEMLGVLMAAALPGQRRPEPAECLDLVRSGLCLRLRPRVHRSDRSAFAAVKVMYLGAVVELAVIVTILVALGDVKGSVLAKDPGNTRPQELEGYVNDAPVEQGPDYMGLAVPLRLSSSAGNLTLLTMVTSFSTAVDVTIAELRLEAFLPADADTAARLESLREMRQP